MLVVAFLLVGCKDKPAARRDANVRPADAPTSIALDAAAVDAATVTPSRVEHTVWKLVDNRHTAHRYIDDELVVDARGIDFARYLRFGGAPQWQLGMQAGTERAALAGKVASLNIPVAADARVPTQITARVHAADKQALELRLNGLPGKKRVALEAGWQTIALPIAEKGAISAGDNTLALQTVGRSKHKVGLSWLRIGATHPPGDQDPLAAATFDYSHDVIELASGASLVWYVLLPEGAHLVAEVAAPCFVEVGARAGDGTFAGGLLGADQDRVDLSASGGKVVRLSLKPRDCPRARIGRPRITVHGPEATPLPKAAPPRYVLVWKLASLRGDPGFEELARASTVFRQFVWVEVDRRALGKAIATPAQLQAILIADASVDALLAAFDKARAKPFFMYADTSRESTAQLSRAIAQLKAWGFWDQTLVIVADAYELAIHDAARYPSGTIVEEGAEATDLIPTVLDALGQPFDGSQGVPLATLAQGIGRGWPRSSYAHRPEGTHVLRIGRWSIQVGSTGVPVVLDVVNDPGGAIDLASLRPIERRMLTDALGLLLPLRSQWKKAEWGVVSNMSPAGALALDEAAAP
jgi:hypothetical protein